jgi:hypothetical protein
MTTAHNARLIADLIEEGIELDERIHALQERKKVIDEQLILAARLAPHEPLVDSGREGKRAMLQGNDGVILPVVFESDMLMRTVQVGSDEYDNLIRSVDDADDGRLHLYSFWRPKSILENRYKDGKKFRADARAKLAPERAEALIAASISRGANGVAKSRVVVSWEAARKSAMPEEGDAE